MQTKPQNAQIDAVTLAVLKGRLEQIADEMDATLYRSAFNPIIAEAHDACHGLYDAVNGDTLIQGKTGLPIFVGAMSFAVRHNNSMIIAIMSCIDKWLEVKSSGISCLALIFT